MHWANKSWPFFVWLGVGWQYGLHSIPILDKVGPMNAKTTLMSVFLVGTIVFSVHAQEFVRVADSDQGMVVCETSHASRIGRDVLAKGGNAVDAAVATAFALAVTWPEAGNVGGGGFMIVYPGNGLEPVCIDYREAAPALANVDTFKKNDARHDRKIVGVPGTVHGLETAHKKYGQLQWADVVAPAALLAQEGFSVDGVLAGSLNGVLSKTDKNNPLFAELHRVYGKADGSPWKAGDTMTLSDLSKTLFEISNRGAKTFYEGDVAKLLLKEMAQGKGLIRAEDLENYEAKIRKPIIGQFKGYQVIGAPPPSSGGTCLVQALNIVEALNIPRDSRYTPETVHLLAEASRRAFLDRARYLGDPDFVKIPTKLTSKDYAKEIAASIDRTRATASESLAPEIQIAKESPNTTHFSVIDGNGMAVSNTYTLEASWGSRIVVAGGGFVLNNEMGDFNWVKGLTDRAGRIGTDANLVEPGKRMLSSQCPVVVAKDNRAFLITGSPGGRTIINTVFNIVVNATHFDMSPAEAVSSPRFHHQWLPDQLVLEDMNEGPFADAIETLQKMGHKVVNRESQGSAHTIWSDPMRQRFVGIADNRRGGRPAGSTSGRLAGWDFGEKRGTKLTDLFGNGNQAGKWSDDFGKSYVDGADHFRVVTDGLTKPAKSAFWLGQNPGDKVSATITFDGIAFKGDQSNESVVMRVNHDNLRPRVTAQVIVGSNSSRQIGVIAKAGGSGATSIGPFIVSKRNEYSEPFQLRLDIDTYSESYSLSIRRGTSIEFKKLGDGKLAADREAKFLQISAANILESEADVINIDMIEVTRQ